MNSYTFRVVVDTTVAAPDPGSAAAILGQAIDRQAGLLCDEGGGVVGFIHEARSLLVDPAPQRHADTLMRYREQRRVNRVERLLGSADLEPPEK